MVNSQLHFYFQIISQCRLVLHSFSLPLFSMTQYVLHLSSAWSLSWSLHVILFVEEQRTEIYNNYLKYIGFLTEVTDLKIVPSLHSIFNAAFASIAIEMLASQSTRTALPPARSLCPGWVPQHRGYASPTGMKPQRHLEVSGSDFLTCSSSTEGRRLFLLVSERERWEVLSSKSVLALALSGGAGGDTRGWYRCYDAQWAGRMMQRSPWYQRAN